MIALGVAAMLGCLLLTGCARAEPDLSSYPAARLAGDVCGDPLFAGAVVVDGGLVLTAAHVVAGSEAGAVTVRLPSGIEHVSHVVGFDPERDLALLTAPGLEGRPIAFGEAESGSSAAIVALDRDDNLTRIRLEVRRPIVATGDDIYGEGSVERAALELDADIAPGLSGAGVYDSDGSLLGLLFAEAREQPVAYAVAASEIRRFIDETDRTGAVETGRCR